MENDALSSINTLSGVDGNAVLKLREARLAQATRPFRARGCRVIRCPRCLLSKKLCLCHTLSVSRADCRFCLVMYDTEPLKPSNTGRLIADVLPNTAAFLWSRTEASAELLALLNSQDYQPYVIFPASYAAPERVTTQVAPESGKRPLFIILDGTWTEARKMFRKSPYLDSLPVLSIESLESSDYRLREASHKEQLCTAEVAVSLLRLAGETPAADRLAAHFSEFRRRYLAGKANVPLENVAD